MPDLNAIIQENKKQRERLEKLVRGLKEADYSRHLANGWTVTAALAHLAFWDLTRAGQMERWLAKGVKPVSLDSGTLNDPLAEVTTGLPAPLASKLVLEAAQRVDRLVENLTPAQAGELAGMGLDLYRGRHRSVHLDKIEKALEV